MEQFTGSFKAGVSLFDTPANCVYLGIEATPNTIIKLNGAEIQLGLRGILELRNIYVESLVFPLGVPQANISRILG